MQITLIVKRPGVAEVPGQPQFAAEADALPVPESGAGIRVFGYVLAILSHIMTKCRVVRRNGYANAERLAEPVREFVVIFKLDAFALEIEMLPWPTVDQYRAVINYVPGNLHLSVQIFVRRNYQMRNRSIDVREGSGCDERQHSRELRQTHITLEGRNDCADRKQGRGASPERSRTMQVG